jgi:hypothetical protein
MKKRLSKPFGVAFVAALLLCAMPIMMPAAKCQPPAPAFWVEPATENFTTVNATVGTLFNVTVWGAVVNDTIAWEVQLGFDSSELQAIAVDYTTGAANEFFTGHTKFDIYPSIDNDVGTVLAGEVLLGNDHIGPASGTLFWVTFEITAAPAQGQSLTSLIDPGYGVASYNTVFVNTIPGPETPLSTAPCSYTYRDSAVWSPNPTFVYCSPNSVRANSPVTCTAVVSGCNPTGMVTWYTNSSTGCFSPSVCTLSSGSCSTTYNDSGAGVVTITANYSGDPNDTPSSGSTILKVNTQAGPSWTFVYCSPNSVYADSPVACTAVVSGCNRIIYIHSIAVLTVNPEPVLPPEVLLNVPYHRQINSYYCGPAALEEVFNFYGPDVPQGQIGRVARTTSDGTYTIDLVRAATFSNMSNSVESQPSINSTGFAGYSTHSLGYATLFCDGMTVEELKAVIAAGYPVIVLTTWHFRVAVGYDDQCIIFQDPYFGSMYHMTYDDFSSDWDYSGHWALLVSPWQVEVSNPRNVMPGDTFNVTATITYPEVYPFNFAFPASSANATITLPSGLTLAPAETARKACENLGPGQSFTVSWQVQCQALGDYKIGVEAEGLVNGYMPPEPPAYPQPYLYQDRIGGTNESILAVTSTPDTSPPLTTEDYNGSWQNHAFVINLTAADDMSGVLETYYRVNGGPEKALSLNGEPLIATPGANNTLEYWSVDWAGNEELPHKFLTNIKRDETPPYIGNPVFSSAINIHPHQGVKVTVNAADALSGIQNVILLYSLDNGVSWVHQAMTLNPSTLLYEATIPGQLAGTLVRFDVTACDQAGNTATVTNGSSDFTYEVPPLSANIICNFEVLNLGFNGQWLTFCLKPPEGYSLHSVNVTSLALNDSIFANPNFTSVAPDKNAVPDLLVCFNRTAVSQFVLSSRAMTGNVTLSFSGRLNDGSLFKCVCTLEVRMPGDVGLDGKVDMRDIAIAGKALGSHGPNYLWYNATSGQTILIPDASPRWNPLADENEDGKIDLRDVALIAKNFGKTYL